MMAATLAAASVRGPVPYRDDQRFFNRFALALALLIVFSFAQFALRGFSRPVTAPWWVHLHGGLMLGWLGLLVAQNVLAQNGSLAVHRKLGWAGAALVLAIVVLGSFTGFKALELHRFPPFFTAAYFLGLSVFGVWIFGAMVAWAVARKRDTQWHRRLMLGATVLLLEPAFGRLLPMPLLMPYGEAVTMLLQLGAIGVLMRHDRRVLGRVHPASIAAAAVVVTAHATFELFSHLSAAQAFASSIAAA